MKSALTFFPRRPCRNESVIESMRICAEWAADLSYEMQMKSFMTMQHDLRKDEFVVLVECGKKNFSAVSQDPQKVFKQVSNKIFKFIGKNYGCEQTKKPASRKKSR